MRQMLVEIIKIYIMGIRVIAIKVVLLTLRKKHHAIRAKGKLEIIKIIVNGIRFGRIEFKNLIFRRGNL